MEHNRSIDSLTMSSLNDSGQSTSKIMEQEEKMLGATEDRGTIHGIEFIYFALAGLMSLSINFIMTAQADDFNTIYPGMNYSFFVVSPQFFSPLCIGISYLIRSIPLRTKILTLIILSSIFFVGIPLIALFWKNDTYGFTLMLLCYFAACMCSMILQGFLLASGSLFPTQGTVVLLTFQPVFNLLMMTIKVIILYLDLSIVMDFMLLWGIFLLLSFGLFFSFLKISNGYRFKRLEEESLVDHNKKPKYLKTIYVIKIELIEIFMIMFLTFLVFPGIFFSINPNQGMSAKTYITTINCVTAVIELLGRPLGYQDFNKYITRIGHIVGVIIAGFLIHMYLTKQYLGHPGIEYLFFVLTGITMYRTSIGSTYLFVKTSKNARDDTREPIGVLMTYALVAGVAAGSFVALGLPYIRDSHS